MSPLCTQHLAPLLTGRKGEAGVKGLARPPPGRETPAQSFSACESSFSPLGNAYVSRFAGDKDQHLVTALRDYNKLYKSCRSSYFANFYAESVQGHFRSRSLGGVFTFLPLACISLCPV